MGRILLKNWTLPSVFIIALVLFAGVSASQAQGNKDFATLSRLHRTMDHVSIETGLSLLDFYGDIQQKERFSTPTIGTHLNVTKHFQEFLFAGLNIQTGNLGGRKDYYLNETGQPDPGKPLYRTFNTRWLATELVAGVDFGSFLGKKNRKTFNGTSHYYRFSPFGSVGFGSIFYRYTLHSVWSEQPKPIREGEGNTSFTVPLTAGFRVYINQFLYAGMQGTFRFVTTDNLDGTSRYLNEQGIDNVRDRFGQFAINVGYTFRYK